MWAIFRLLCFALRYAGVNHLTPHTPLRNCTLLQQGADQPQAASHSVSRKEEGEKRRREDERKKRKEEEVEEEERQERREDGNDTAMARPNGLTQCDWPTCNQ